jgi:signal peptidase I
MPGDQLLIQNGKVFINGNELDEPYIRFSASYTYPADGQPIVVPAGQYFVLGDNRPNSRDSHFGWFVPADDLIGRATLSYWPPANWGVFPSVAYANA